MHASKIPNGYIINCVDDKMELLSICKHIEEEYMTVIILFFCFFFLFIKEKTIP